MVGKITTCHLVPVPTSNTSAYWEEQAIPVLKPGSGSSRTPCANNRTSNEEEANDRGSSGSKFVSSKIAEVISAQIVSALVQSLKMNIPTISLVHDSSSLQSFLISLSLFLSLSFLSCVLTFFPLLNYFFLISPVNWFCSFSTFFLLSGST